MNKTTPRSSPAPGTSSSQGGHMAEMSDMLMAQARSLDTIFTDMAGQTTKNLTDWPSMARAYANLAIRAQTNCRASLEAVARVERAMKPDRDDQVA